jgi:murein DD-endopeptidase MepM/ murein hydrolase activator NlpD
MKKTIISATLILLVSFAQSANLTATDSSKVAFYSAFDALKNMLDGKDSLNFEKAVFITENAYYGNNYKYDDFNKVLDVHTELIKAISENARLGNQEKFKTLKLYEQKMFNLNTLNWAIYKYITDTTFVMGNDFIYYNEPFNYSTDDPYGSTQWENTQVIHLLTSKNPRGNCYSLSAFFKILSDRLKSEARLVTTPHHIYIQNRNQRGDFKNVELATKAFPGDGSIQVLSYTTKTSIMNGMAQQPLTDKQAIVLNLIYLAKGFEHKFNDNTNDFLLKCADLAFKYDTLSMNALLLKAEVSENILFQSLRQNKISTVQQARTNLKTQKLLANYEKQLSNLYKCGYREIPKDIQHIILSAIQGNKDGYITTDKTPNPFAEIGKTTRYATLSGGLFDEMHYPVDTIKYFHASLNTKKKKIIEFLPIDTSNDYKVDPVVFAMSVDPLTKMYPWQSPYAYTRNNPIFFIDVEGLGDPLAVMQIRQNSANNVQGVVRTDVDKKTGQLINRVHQGFDLYAKSGTPIMAVKDAVVFSVVHDEKAAYGNEITLKITNDKGEVRYAQYSHLSKINVTAGDKVTEGQDIGQTGTSGNATGMKGANEHLHFEYRDEASPGKGLGGRLDPNEVLDTKFYPQNADESKIRQGGIGVIKVDKGGNATKMDPISKGGKETPLKDYTPTTKTE